MLPKDHKELKSARDPNVGPPDRPGSRVHCCYMVTHIAIFNSSFETLHDHAEYSFV